jgi:hypothetical protein
MKNFIKAGIILFSLTTQLEASLISNDLVLDNTSAMTQLLEASLVSNDLVLDNISATVKVQQKPLPARWLTVVSGITGVYFILAGVTYPALSVLFLWEQISNELLKKLVKQMKMGFIATGMVCISIGLGLSTYTVKRIVNRHKAKKVLKMEEQQAYKKTQLVSSFVAQLGLLSWYMEFSSF